MQLSCIWLRKYLGEVRIFQVATEKYLGNKNFFEQRKRTNFSGQSFQIKKKITV